MPVSSPRGGIVAFDSVLLVSGERGTLWSIAGYLRLSPSELFVYGTAVDLSEDASVSSLPAQGIVFRIHAAENGSF